MQRHHLIPRQALRIAGFSKLFMELGPSSVGIHDFRRNGLLLPAKEMAAERLGLPLHRGPHRVYNEMVIERLGVIEAEWARNSSCTGVDGRAAALARLALLQRALRRRLLDVRKPLRLNRHDPVGADKDFSFLDAMAEQLWAATGDQAVA